MSSVTSISNQQQDDDQPTPKPSAEDSTALFAGEISLYADSESGMVVVYIFREGFDALNVVWCFCLAMGMHVE